MEDWQTIVVVFILIAILIDNFAFHKSRPKVNFKRHIENETKTMIDRNKQKRIQLGLEPLFTSQKTVEVEGS